jgi:hypothetical protein
MMLLLKMYKDIQESVTCVLGLLYAGITARQKRVVLD